MRAPWKPTGPSDGLQRWARFVTRYLIGVGGLIYETLIDHLHNPTALVVFGGLIGLPDVIGYRQMVKTQARAELEDELERER